MGPMRAPTLLPYPTPPAPPFYPKLAPPPLHSTTPRWSTS
jgi:hypothetical protein